MTCVVRKTESRLIAPQKCAHLQFILSYNSKQYHCLDCLYYNPAVAENQEKSAPEGFYTVRTVFLRSYKELLKEDGVFVFAGLEVRYQRRCFIAVFRSIFLNCRTRGFLGAGLSMPRAGLRQKIRTLSISFSTNAGTFNLPKSNLL
jgi:hypothetical protein